MLKFQITGEEKEQQEIVKFLNTLEIESSIVDGDLIIDDEGESPVLLNWFVKLLNNKGYKVQAKFDGVYIDGELYADRLNGEKREVYFAGIWRMVHEDANGKEFIMFNDKKHWFDGE